MTCNTTSVCFPIFPPRSRSLVLTAVVAAIVSVISAPAHADTIVNVSIVGTGGSGGSGTSASDMVYSQYQTNGDGWGWAGGAGAVQGNAAINNSGGSTSPANEALNFNIGSAIDALNADYPQGWTITGSTLSFASSYAKQNNSRFGVGSGTFDIFWVANNTWSQSEGTPANRGTNPIYATSAASLLTWSGSQSLLGSEAFDVPQGGSGYVDLSYPLAADASFQNAIYSATAVGGARKKSICRCISWTLPPAPDTLGMIIFSGGQSQPLPTLTIDAVAAPEPATFALLAIGGVALARYGWRRRKGPRSVLAAAAPAASSHDDTAVTLSFPSASSRTTTRRAA